MSLPARGLLIRFSRDEFVLPALWFIVLTLACTAAGSIVGSRSALAPMTFRLICFYVVLLIPVFVNRQALYEAAESTDRRPESLLPWFRYIASLALFLPGLLLVIFAFIIEPAFGPKVWRALTHVPIASSDRILGYPAWAVAHLLVAVTPFYVYAYYINYCWPQSRVISFRHRSIFPAVFAIMISVAFGWTLTQRGHATEWAAILTTAFWIASDCFTLRYRALTLFASAFLALLAATLLLALTSPLQSFLPTSECSVLLLGALMASCILVCEGWRVTVKVAEAGHSGRTMDYSRMATVASGSALQWFLLTYLLHPAMTVPYAVLVCALALSLTTCWMVSGPILERRYSRWFWLSALGALLIPIVVAVTVRIPAPIIERTWSTEHVVSIGFGAISVGLGVFGSRWKSVTRMLKALIRGDITRFDNIREGRLLFVASTSVPAMIAGVVVIILELLAKGAGPAVVEPYLSQRCAVLSILFAATSVAALVIYLVGYGTRQGGPDDNRILL